MPIQVTRTTHPQKVTICVLLYGDYLPLAMRCLQSIMRTCPRDMYILRVGCNACSSEVLRYVNDLMIDGEIDDLYISNGNINKCPMMRRMFKDIQTEWIWWFDDDSHIVSNDALQIRLTKVLEDNGEVDMYGHVFFFGNASDFDYGLDIISWVKKQDWYQGKPIPCGVTCYEEGFNKNGDDTRWFFITGGNWFIKTEVVETLDWPTKTLIKRNDDVILCSALRQNGYKFACINESGVKINDYPRRGEGEDKETMQKQIQ